MNLEYHAEKQHQIWSQWMKKQLARCEEQPDGSLLIPKHLRHIWEFQALCDYDDFEEEKKDEYRNIVKDHLNDALLENPEATCFVDLCIDFDGVLHSYISGWQGIDVIADPPVDGAFNALYAYISAGHTLAIHSARSAENKGRSAIRDWIAEQDAHYCKAETEKLGEPHVGPVLNEHIRYPKFKPQAKVYLDDRGYRFTGQFPNIQEQDFRPWNKKK